MGTLFKHHGTSVGYLMEPLIGTKVLLVDDDNAGRDPLAEAMQMMGATMSFPRTSEIFGESEPTDYV